MNYQIEKNQFTNEVIFNKEQNNIEILIEF